MSTMLGEKLTGDGDFDNYIERGLGDLSLYAHGIDPTFPALGTHDDLRGETPAVGLRPNETRSFVPDPNLARVAGLATGRVAQLVPPANFLG